MSITKVIWWTSTNYFLDISVSFRFMCVCIYFRWWRRWIVVVFVAIVVAVSVVIIISVLCIRKFVLYRSLYEDVLVFVQRFLAFWCSLAFATRAECALGWHNHCGLSIPIVLRRLLSFVLISIWMFAPNIDSIFPFPPFNGNLHLHQSQKRTQPNNNINTHIHSHSVAFT